MFAKQPPCCGAEVFPVIIVPMMTAFILFLYKWFWPWRCVVLMMRLRMYLSAAGLERNEARGFLAKAVGNHLIVSRMDSEGMLNCALVAGYL